MSGRAVMTVGAVLRGDDAAGPLLAKLMQERPVDGWEVIDAGQVPEDYVSVARRMAPDLLVLVDAASMGLEPGAVRSLAADDVACDYLFTTHSLPISLVLSELERACGEVAFVGVQPQQTEFFSPMTPAVYAAVEGIHTAFLELGLGTDDKIGAGELLGRLGIEPL